MLEGSDEKRTILNVNASGWSSGL